LITTNKQTNKQTKGRWCTFDRTTGRATRPEWIYSQGVCFEPRAGGEVRILGIYNNKQMKKQLPSKDFITANKQTNKYLEEKLEECRSTVPKELGYLLSVFNKNSTL